MENQSEFTQLAIGFCLLHSAGTSSVYDAMHFAKLAYVAGLVKEAEMAEQRFTAAPGHEGDEWRFAAAEIAEVVMGEVMRERREMETVG